MAEIVTFWDDHPLAGTANELFEKLVPADGNSDSLQGELLRASSRISYDWLNNGWGCNNWSGAVIFLQKFFGDLPNQPAPEVLLKLKHELSYVYEWSHGEPAPQNEDRADFAVTTIHEIVVQAILDNPTPIANTRDIFDFSEEDYRSHNGWGEDDDPTIDELRAAAEKAGMAKFMFLDDDKGPKKNVPYVIGADSLERLHEQLVKANAQP